MDNRKELAEWRFEKAEQCLKTAKISIETGDYAGAANRSYYCVFHCIRSVFALHGVDFKKHAAVIAYFREKYIKTGIFEKRLSDIIGKLFILRNESDYDDFFIINKSSIVEQVENAEYFMEQIKNYLDNYKLKD